MAGIAPVRRFVENSRFFRFVLVGVANTAIHYTSYLVLWIVLPYVAAHLIAVTIAMSCSYLLNCHYTFRTRPTVRKFLLYPISNITNIALSTLALFILVEVFLVDSRVATIVGGLLAVPATFLVSRLILVGRS